MSAAKTAVSSPSSSRATASQASICLRYASTQRLQPKPKHRSSLAQPGLVSADASSSMATISLDGDGGGGGPHASQPAVRTAAGIVSGFEQKRWISPLSTLSRTSEVHALAS